LFLFETAYFDHYTETFETPEKCLVATLLVFTSNSLRHATTSGITMLLRIIIPYPVKSVLKQGSNKHTQDFCGCFDDGLNPYRAHNTHAHLVRKP